MNKKFIILLSLFIFFFVGISNVYADNCAQINDNITLYNEYKDEIEKLNCSDINSQEQLDECYDNKLKKNNIVAKFMQQKLDNTLCDSNKKEVEAIIDENKDKCGKIIDDDLARLVNNLYKLFYILGPILLIVFASLDYTKAIVSSDKDFLKKTNQRFVKRIIATIFLFISPALVNLIIGFNSSSYNLSTSAYACEIEYMTYNEELTIKTIENTKKKRPSGGGGGSGTYSMNGSGNGTSVSGINFTTNYSNMIYKGGPLPIPFPEDNYSLGSPFGMRLHPIYGEYRLHKGVDLTATYNGSLDVPILAVADGVVVDTAAGCVVGDNNCGAGFGNYVKLSHNINGEEFESEYAHMKNDPLVTIGQTVSAGTQLGIQGSTGTSTGEHLHFGIIVHGSNVDPYPYITGKSSS